MGARVKSETLYFDRPGKENTEAVLAAVKKRAQELGIRQVVVASTHGYTARRAAHVLGDLDVEIIAVSICAAFDDQGWSMSAAEREQLEAAGVKVLTSMHALGDDVNEAFAQMPANRIVRETLYRFCQGMKVVVEVAIMAAEAGMLDTTRECIVAAGSSQGADTAVVMKPAFARKFQELEILEILAKPRSG